MTPEERFDQNQRLVHYVYAKHFDQNQRLVHYVYAKRFQQNTTPWKEDILQEGFIALWRACCAYDETKGFEFSTFACACIHRSMLTYIDRKVRKHSEFTLSFEEIVSEDSDGNQIRIADCLADISESDVCEQNDLLRSVLDQCPHRMKQVSILMIQGYTQDEIGKALNVSQSTVARDWEKFKRKFKRCLEETK